MQSPSDDGPDTRVVDNAVILLSLLVTRYYLSKHQAVYPSRIYRSLLMRITELIRRYKNPENGISFNDPGNDPGDCV
jgi:hypothetical protein